MRTRSRSRWEYRWDTGFMIWASLTAGMAAADRDYLPAVMFLGVACFWGWCSWQYVREQYPVERGDD